MSFGWIWVLTICWSLLVCYWMLLGVAVTTTNRRHCGKLTNGSVGSYCNLQLPVIPNCINSIQHQESIIDWKHQLLLVIVFQIIWEVWGYCWITWTNWRETYTYSKWRQPKIMNIYYELEMQEYLLSGDRNITISKLIFEARGYTLDIKTQKKWKYSDKLCCGCELN